MNNIPSIKLENLFNDNLIEMINEKLGINDDIRYYAERFASKISYDVNVEKTRRVRSGLFVFSKVYKEMVFDKPLTLNVRVLKYGSKTLYDERDKSITDTCEYKTVNGVDTIRIRHSMYNGNIFFDTLTGNIAHELEHMLFLDYTTPPSIEGLEDAFKHAKVGMRLPDEENKKYQKSIAKIYYYTENDEISASSHDSYYTLRNHGDNIENYIRKTSIYKRSKELEDAVRFIQTDTETPKQLKNTLLKKYKRNEEQIIERGKWGIKRYRHELAKIAALVAEENFEKTKF